MDIFDKVRQKQRTRILKMVKNFNVMLEPCFDFGMVKKQENPKEYFAGVVLNKIYSLNISLENIIFTNDIFLTNYLYRYVYELYAKVFYIFSDSTGSEVKKRLDEFFDNKRIEVIDYLKNINKSSIPENLKEKHKERYLIMNRIAHPNIESLRLHIDKTKEQQFDFLFPMVNLIFWHTAEILRLFSHFKLLGIDHKLNLDKLYSLQTQ